MAVWPDLGCFDWPAAAQNPPPTLIRYGDVIADKFTAEQTRFEYQFEAEEGMGYGH